MQYVYYYNNEFLEQKIFYLLDTINLWWSINSTHWRHYILMWIATMMFTDGSQCFLKSINCCDKRFVSFFIYILFLNWYSAMNCAHATTAKLSCHEQTFLAISFIEFTWEQNEISIEFELLEKSEVKWVPWHPMTIFSILKLMCKWRIGIQLHSYSLFLTAKML